jgi:RHS repeat-associated protein
MIDAASYIAEVRVGAAFPEDSSPDVKYMVGDHLGSAVVVVGDDGVWVNREEFTPYGETSFGSFARKRFRFTGKQRDAESGLCYHGARYMAPWLGRWVSCDPAGGVDGPNLYVYAKNCPLRMVDPTGLDDVDVDNINPPSPAEEAAGMSSEQLHTFIGPPKAAMDTAVSRDQTPMSSNDKASSANKKMSNVLSGLYEPSVKQPPDRELVKRPPDNEPFRPFGITGVYVFLGFDVEHDRLVGEGLGLFGYSFDKGFYYGRLEAFGHETSHHTNVTTAIETVQYIKSGETEQESTTMLDVTVGKRKKRDVSVGVFYNNEDPNQAGAYYSEKLGDVTGGVGVTIDVDQLLSHSRYSMGAFILIGH